MFLWMEASSTPRMRMPEPESIETYTLSCTDLFGIVRVKKRKCGWKIRVFLFGCGSNIRYAARNSPTQNKNTRIFGKVCVIWKIYNRSGQAMKGVND